MLTFRPFLRASAGMLAAALMNSLFAVETSAQELPKKAAKPSVESNVPEVPGDDIFGFTAPTDIGNPGDTGFANEIDGRFGKRSGSYSAWFSKYEFSRTLSEDWWIAGSFFGAYHHSRNVPDIADINKLAFLGLSFEIERRIFRRSAGNPFAVSVSVEPAWARIDGTTGQPSNAYGAAFKFFIDAVVVPDKLFWAANLIWAPQTAE